MEDRKLTEQESLDLIATMISRTKSRYFGLSFGAMMLLPGYAINYKARKNERA